MKKFLLAILVVVLIYLIVTVYLVLELQNITTFGNARIPTEYISRENLSKSDWKYHMSYLRLEYGEDISDKINEESINLLEDSDDDYLFEKDEADVLMGLQNKYGRAKDLDDENLYGHLRYIYPSLENHEVDCYGYIHTTSAAYFIYDKEDFVVHIFYLAD